MALFDILVNIAAKTASFEDGMKRIEGRLDSFAEHVKEVGVHTAEFFGIGLGISALTSAIEEAVNRGEQLTRLSDRMGVTVESLSQLQFAAKATHIPFEALTGTFDTFEKNLGMASEGLGRAKKAFAELHIDAAKLLALPFDQQLSIIADKIAKIQNPAKQTQLVMQMFGDANMLSILRLGAEGIAKVREESDKLNFTLGRDSAEKLKAAEEEMIKVKASTTALSTELAIGLGPTLETIAGNLVKSTRGLIEFGREMDLLAPSSKLDGLTRQLDGLVATRRNLEKELSATDSGGSLFERMMTGGKFETGATNDKVKEALQKQLNDTIAQMRAINGQIIAEEKRLQDEREKKKSGGTDTVTSPLQEFDTNHIKLMKEYEDKITEFYRRLDEMSMTSTETEVNNFYKKEAALKSLLHQGEISLDEYHKREKEELDKLLPGLEVTAKHEIDNTTKTITQIQEFANQAARNMETSFANFLFDPFKKGLKGMLSGFIDVLRRMVAEAVSADLLKAMFGSGPSNAGGTGLGGLFGSFLGAFMGGGAGAAGSLGATSGVGELAGSTVGFAAGGANARAGQPFVIGENGPELFVPDSAGAIMPNSVFGGGGGSPTFNHTYNIDARGADAERIMTIMPTLLAHVRAATKRDILSAFERGGYAAPRTA